MRYVYLIRSISHPGQHYIGITSDPDKRLQEHNSRKSPHTSEYAPWKAVVTICFEDDDRAFQFERHLKTDLGRAFANRHFF
jgi:putative endonuclease